ncbi:MULTISPECIES: 3'-5' exoribonuclease YhaM [Halobacillus]|uniref:3'-5' exoribonuclease YhaM n=1 Tax=Halobacillus halophilus (strain ATCC 35676 / DSM 2266 / JCM 20832 / KCTC 3685 / LMG 17431 / NBRC 102448 / NCIMB 2269) TaxID=866895 RepID=I0JK84_HALH3|nr:3'-5' exoribonuclease YhaM [Halobacillus halophilus]ASF38701.1 3'-5' exoribonuclease YhaM [Halobacillus halophilus]CCG44553.1 3'-5' exoribonuclease YhaM [Halobacillus halophilus DSM 2266]
MKKGIAHYQIGDSFDYFLLIKTAVKGVASNGKPFLTLLLKDQTGEIDAKLWEASSEDERVFQQGELVKVTGEVGQFRNKPQLKIHSIRPSQPTDGVFHNDFIEKAPVEKEELMERITEAIFEMKNANFQRITRQFVKQYQEDLLSYPAAVRNHHEYVSGLAHHIVSMLNIAKEMSKLYPDIDKDLLYAGIILHDLGKIKEFSNAVAPSYTTEGKLIGHISLMAEEVRIVANDLQIEGEEVTVLQHMILSHHGKGEWGSPRPPLIREAELLHHIDMLDARMNMLDRALKKTAPGEFTEKIYPMEQRAFYKPSFEDK